MLVSVIVPNYNHAQFLSQRLDSILNQSYSDIEIIILDDCSTDQSIEVIQRYKKHYPTRITVVTNEINSGSTFAQWKFGVEMAKGEWIWIAESDDYCEFDFLESLIHNNELETCLMRFCLSSPVDVDGNHIDGLNYRKIRTGKFSGDEFLSEHLLEVNAVVNASSVVVNTMVLRRILKNLGSELSKYKLFGDWLVWVNACMLTDIGCVSVIKNFHRHHSTTVRTKAINDNYFFKEQRIFREYLKNLITDASILKKSELLKKLDQVNAHEFGNYGCLLIRQNRVLKAIPYILVATYSLGFNPYYIRSSAYWFFKGFVNKQT
jgi:glycosyltransferase involved in cell wall biosynthesis